MNFIKTTDVETAEKLKTAGFTLVNKSGNCWTFMNDKNTQFSENEKKKIVYSNKLEMVI